MRGGGFFEGVKNLVKGNISEDKFIQITDEIKNTQDFNDKATKYVNNNDRLDHECASKTDDEYEVCQKQKVVIYGKRLEQGMALLKDFNCTDDLRIQIEKQNTIWRPGVVDHYDKSTSGKPLIESPGESNDSLSQPLDQ
jgi:hypothetical protein